MRISSIECENRDTHDMIRDFKRYDEKSINFFFLFLYDALLIFHLLECIIETIIDPIDSRSNMVLHGSLFVPWSIMEMDDVK